MRQHSHKVEQQAKLRELGVPSPQGPWVTLPLGGRLSSRGDFTSVPSVLAPKLQQCLQLQEMLSVWILLTSPSCPNSGGYPHSSTAASGEAYHADSPLNPHSTAALEVQPALPCPPLPTPCTRHPPPGRPTCSHLPSRCLTSSVPRLLHRSQCHLELLPPSLPVDHVTSSGKHPQNCGSQ